MQIDSDFIVPAIGVGYEEQAVVVFDELVEFGVGPLARFEYRIIYSKNHYMLFGDGNFDTAEDFKGREVAVELDQPLRRHKHLVVGESDAIESALDGGLDHLFVIGGTA